MVNFATAVTDFTRFATEQGYPPRLLWTSHDSVLIGRRRYFILDSGPEKGGARAQTSFDAAAARQIGVAIEAMCKTSTTTICRLVVPIDNADAQCRLIPATGVKFAAAVDPLPAIVIKYRLLWWILKRICKLSFDLWD